MFGLPLQLCTQIIEKNANPEWNQLLNLQIKVRGSVEGKMLNHEINQLKFWLNLLFHIVPLHV